MSYANSVLQAWVMELRLRHQGVLLTGLRGCDGKGKYDPSKTLTRAIRVYTLIPFDRREQQIAGEFMSFLAIENLIPAVKAFKADMDAYPIHFVLHLMHAIQVIGYHHPTEKVRQEFTAAYCILARAMHLRPESKPEMDARLTEDRIALIHTDAQAENLQ